jgi:hypothetical protein
MRYCAFIVDHGFKGVALLHVQFGVLAIQYSTMLFFYLARKHYTPYHTIRSKPFLSHPTSKIRRCSYLGFRVYRSQHRFNCVVGTLIVSYTLL